MGKNAILGFHLIDDVDELLTDEIAETHEASLSDCSLSPAELQQRPDANVRVYISQCLVNLSRSPEG
jgi:hypothetical protein